MASVASPYGFKVVQALGGRPFTGGTIREIKQSTNVASGLFNGQLVVLSSAGNPSGVITTSPTTGTTAGIVGVCVGVRYTDPVLKQTQYAQYLPAGAITAGYTNVWIRVVDDPDVILQIQGDAAFGTLTNGADGAIGKNAAISFGTNSTTTGNAVDKLVVGTNGGSLASTNTLAFRIVGYVAGTENDTYPDILVKYNFGLHSYHAALGI